MRHSSENVCKQSIKTVMSDICEDREAVFMVKTPNIWYSKQDIMYKI